jgi:hypothetical protein
MIANTIHGNSIKQQEVRYEQRRPSRFDKLVARTVGELKRTGEKSYE